MVQTNYNGLTKSGGVYAILNNHNGRIYIGSCKRFWDRWQHGHTRSLLLNKHSNKFLQADFNKLKEALGNDNFLEFHILINMPNSSKEERLTKEEEWLKVYFDGGNQCYNLCNRAISREASNNKEFRSDKGIPRGPRTEEVKRKISLAHTGRKHSPEHREKNRLGHLGFPVWNKGKTCPQIAGENHPMFGKKHSKESIAKMKKSLAGKRPWNKDVTGYKMPPCSEDKKKKISMANKGRRLSEEHCKKISLARKGKYAGREAWGAKVYDNLRLLSPEGTLYTRIDCLTVFAKEHDLNMKCLWKVIKGKTPSTRGWRLL